MAGVFDSLPAEVPLSHARITAPVSHSESSGSPSTWLGEWVDNRFAGAEPTALTGSVGAVVEDSIIYDGPAYLDETGTSWWSADLSSGAPLISTLFIEPVDDPSARPVVGCAATVTGYHVGTFDVVGVVAHPLAVELRVRRTA